MNSIASFGEEQLNRIFPFYIVINDNLTIASNGKTLDKMYPGIGHDKFSRYFRIQRPKIDDNSFKSIKDLNNQIVVLECLNEKGTALRGQIEWLKESNQLLFIGSPWFDSIESVIGNNLSLHDFAFHDPMIDLLHVLKTQEITTDELKQLLKTVNRQKNELKKAAIEIEDIALFTTQNPDPLIRIDFDGKLLRQNPVADQFNHFIFEEKKQKPQAFWKKVAKSIDPEKDRVILEAEANEETYSFLIRPIPESGYYNIYGRNITEEKKNAAQLEILSSLVAENTHGVVIADKDGKIEWANASFEHMTGYTLDEMIGEKPGHLLQGPDTDPVKVKYLSEQISKGEPFICEILNYNKNKQPYWLRIQGQALKDQKGQITKYFAIEEDISVEIENRRKLSEFESRFKMALEKIGDYVWEHNFHTGHTQFSKKENHFIGVNTVEIENNAELWWNSVLKADRSKLEANDRRYRSGKQDNHILEYRLRHRDGSIKWVLDRGVVIEKDTSGKPIVIIGTHTDITRQKTLELELEATANRLTSLIQNLYSGVLLENENRTIGFLNQKFCDLFQIPVAPDQLIGTDCSQAADQSKHLFKDPDLFVHRIAQILEEKEIVINEYLEMADGTHFHRDFIPIWNGNEYAGHLWLYTDITEQINADKKLEDQRTFYEQILNKLPADIAVFDNDHRYLFLNPQAIKNPELRSWMIGKRDEDYVAYRKLPEAIAEGRRKLFKTALDSKTLQVFEEELKQSDGSSKYILRNLHPVLNESNDVELVLGYGIDITPIKEIQNQITESEKRYRDVIENSLALITTHDLTGKFISVNPMVGKTYGYADEEMIGRPLTDFLSKGDSELFHSEYLPRIKQKKQYSGIFRVRGKSGKTVYTLYNNFLKEEAGTAPYVIGFAVDISERIHAEKELKLAKKATEELADAKQNFLANMSHEIRTPMNAIIGMSNQLSKTPLSDQQNFYLNTIHTAADNLLVIINDILDLSKIDAGKLSIEEIGFDPKHVISDALQVLMHKAEEKGIKLMQSSIDPKLSKVLIGDPHRLNQVLLNLMSNAIKFTDRGFVDVTCEVMKDTGSAQKIQFRVVDTGVGMDKAFVKKLFKKFSQEDVSVSRRFGGTGLGMAITQSLIQLMGGTIDVQSKKNKGTTITFELLLNKGKLSELNIDKQKEIKTDMLVGRKVLVVDDNEMNRLVASTILKNYKVSILEAENGMEALEKIESDHPEVVLMDLQMPVLNGIEASKIIRDRGNDIPIIALTANAIKGENEKCYAAGMNDYISKPYREEELLQKLIIWLNKFDQNIPFQQTASLPSENVAPLYDLSALKDLSNNDQEFITKMTNLFCAQTPVTINKMIEHYNSGDLVSMGKLAHKIKPTLNHLQILSIKEDIRTIEKAGKEGSPPPELKAILTKVKNTVKNVVQQMQQA
jgi:PAS domain S-box-containing protein